MGKKGEGGGKNMKFLTDDDGLAISIDRIIAIKIKENKNDGSFKNRKEYPFVADVHVEGREKPFTIYLSESQNQELSQFTQIKGGGS